MWISPDSATTRWRYRTAVTVDNTAAASSPKDVNIDLSTLGDGFWENLQGTGGAGLRVTRADGYTLGTFERVSWSVANRTGTLEVDQLSFDTATAGMFKGYVYFGSTNASVSDGSTTVPAPSSPLTGHVMRRAQYRGLRVRYSPQRRGATRPRIALTKGSGETVHVFWDISAALARFSKPQHGSTAYEEVRHASFNVLQSSSDVPSLYTASATRFIGTGIIRTTITGGTSGQLYTPSLTVTTTLGRVFNPRCLLEVRDVNET